MTKSLRDLPPFDLKGWLATNAPPTATAPPAAPEPQPIEPLLSVDDLARVLATSRRTVERLRSAGRLPRHDLLIGRMPRWRPETIRGWIDTQSHLH